MLRIIILFVMLIPNISIADEGFKPFLQKHVIGIWQKL
jgi:hypothetical protein